jgi:hypothetical protein
MYHGTHFDISRSLSGRNERLNELLDVIDEEDGGDVNRLYGKILEFTHKAETNTAAGPERV